MSDIETIQIELLDLAVKHGKHNQASHGRKTARRRAYSAAYSSARAGGSSPAEARTAAREAGMARQSERDTRLERLREASQRGKTDTRPSSYWDTLPGLKEEQDWNRSSMAKIDAALAEAKQRKDKTRIEQIQREKEDFTRRIEAMDKLIAKAERASQPIARERVESVLSAGEAATGQSYARALSRQVSLTERDLNEVATIRDAYNRAFNNGSSGIVALPYASQMIGSGKSPIENLRDAARSTDAAISWPAQQVLSKLEK
jgi:hypothetical protein